MITNDTIIKAAKAAGLDAALGGRDPFGRLWVNGSVFNPLHNDTDNAMIRRGAEIDVQWLPTSGYVEATAFLPDFEFFPFEIGYNDDKGAAEREAVILCAAAKFDAMQGEVK